MTDEPFNLVPFDGILGLGMPKMSVLPMFNLMGELAEDNALKHNQSAGAKELLVAFFAGLSRMFWIVFCWNCT